MREIKFRAWDKDQGIWIYNVSYNARSKCFTWPSCGFTVGTDKGYQYTGLKDKNGVEIYEGDIVKDLDSAWVGNISVVQHGTCCGGYFPFSDEIGPSSEDVEVIGNILINPELLENDHEKTNS